MVQSIHKWKHLILSSYLVPAQVNQTNKNLLQLRSRFNSWKQKRKAFVFILTCVLPWQLNGDLAHVKVFADPHEPASSIRAFRPHGSAAAAPVLFPDLFSHLFGAWQFAARLLKWHQHGTRSGQTGVGRNRDAEVRRWSEVVCLHEEEGLRRHPEPPPQQGERGHAARGVFACFRDRLTPSCCLHLLWEMLRQKYKRKCYISCLHSEE